MKEGMAQSRAQVTLNSSTSRPQTGSTYGWKEDSEGLRGKGSGWRKTAWGKGMASLTLCWGPSEGKQTFICFDCLFLLTLFLKQFLAGMDAL